MKKKGVALLLVIIFLLVCTITSIGLYGGVYNLYRMHGINEVKSVKGYYAALGSLRFLCNVNPPVGMTISKNSNVTLWAGLGLRDSENIIITVTPLVEGQYTVTATYSSN